MHCHGIPAAICRPVLSLADDVHRDFPGRRAGVADLRRALVQSPLPAGAARGGRLTGHFRTRKQETGGRWARASPQSLAEAEKSKIEREGSVMVRLIDGSGVGRAIGDAS